MWNTSIALEADSAECNACIAYLIFYMALKGFNLHIQLDFLSIVSPTVLNLLSTFGAQKIDNADIAIL